MFENEIKLYESRIEVFIKRIQGLFYEANHRLDVTFSKAGTGRPFSEKTKGEFNPVNTEDSWGENWDRAWFHIKGEIPGDWNGKYVIARINLGGESLIFTPDGMPVCGLSVHTVWEPHTFIRDRVDISPNASGGETVEFWSESSAGQLFGVKLNWDTGDQSPQKFGEYKAKFQYAELRVFRKDIWDLYLDFKVLSGLMKSLPEKSVRRKRILKSLNDAIDIFQKSEEKTAEAKQIVDKELSKPASASDLHTQAVGHAHIDTAWLWPIHESIRKCARTYSSQMALIDKYPGYVFGASQAQHFAFMKEYYPDFYKKIKAYVKDGRIEVQGGMWVEADCNLISGESMVRQILHGKNFFKDEFGIDVKNMWIPDVFGYSAAMPQIMKKTGTDFFVTQKISWNQFNRFPHHTFMWRGIDGTEVPVHFPPEDNYSSELKPEALIKARDNFNESTYLDEFLTLFGVGDGGSGATEEMIESGLRQKNLENTPQVHFGSAQDMLDRLSEKLDKLPVWAGELYLELHRGTLTTQAYNKKMNRFMELKLRELEILYSILPFDKYPLEQLDSLWKKVLLYQFHDIIPGSSITPVYDECTEGYEKMWAEAGKLLTQAGELLFISDENHLTLFNTLSLEYTRPIELPADWSGFQLRGEEGEAIPAQMEDDKMVILAKIPALSSLVLKKTDNPVKNLSDPESKNFILENDLILYEFDEQGTISRIYDKETGKEVLAEGTKGNLFGYYEDRPADWDAWDIDIYYENQLLEHPKLVDRKWLVKGPARSGFLQQMDVGNSTFSQKIYLNSNSRRLDFETDVDWNENHKMLRVSFEVNIYSDQATYEIQYGNVKRNTHRNTSYDMAKFEVVGHRYADLSDKNYGAALISSCKYGYKTYDNIIDLNLLRSPTNPDPKADRGQHSFRYSFLPHKNSLENSVVLSEAAQLDQAPALFPNKRANSINMPVLLDSDAVVLEVLKKAEKESALIIRLYEPVGKETTADLKISETITRIFETNMMEENIKELNIHGNKLKLDFKAYEIKTFKFYQE